MEEQLQSNTEPSLWLMFKLQEEFYAVDCRYVESIFEITQEIIPVARTDESILGLIELRGATLPIMDLRKRLHMPSVQEETAAFEEMLALRKQDHINWVEALRHSIHSGEEFKLATDPHRCKFGKWYDSFKPSSRAVKIHFDQIHAPHDKLHESALRCFATHDGEERQRILKEVSEKAMHQVLRSIDSAFAAHKNSLRRMCIAVFGGDVRLGLLVDEIAFTGQLQDRHELDAMSRNPSVHAAAQTAQGDGVLLLDIKQILSEIEKMGEDAEPGENLCG